MLNPDSIWTRVRKLEDERVDLITKMREGYSILAEGIAGSKWELARITSGWFVEATRRMEALDRELEFIRPLAEGFDAVCKRMEELEEGRG